MDGGEKCAFDKGNKKQINRVVNDHIQYVIVWIIWMNVMFLMNDFTALLRRPMQRKKAIFVFVLHRMNYFMQEHLCSLLRLARSAIIFSYFQ